MKKIFKTIAVAGLCILAAACNKNYSPAALPSDGEDLVDVCVNVSGALNAVTKADTVATDHEKSYSNAYVIIFDSEGKMETYKAWSGSSLTFSLKKGTKNFVAVLNAGTDVTSVATRSEFDARLFSLSDIESKGFLMQGEVTKTVEGSTVDVIITVKRLAAKVAVGSFKVAFDSPMLSSKPVTLDSVYLINASAKNKYDGSLAGEWANRMCYESGSPSCLVKASNLSVTQGQTYDLDYVFYMLPNPTEADAHNGSWSARHTRIVFALTVDGTKYYYNKTFGSVVSNGLYTVGSTVITKTGADTPDAEMDQSGAAGQIQISNWDFAGNYDEDL